VDEDCLDGIFCNGLEQCLDGFCVPGGWPCSYGDTCDEEVGCFELRTICDVDEDCDDGFFCNGFEECLSGLCFSSEPPCTDGLLCDEDAAECIFLPPVQGPMVFAYPEFEQSSRIFFEDIYGDADYDVIYFLDDFSPEPRDELRFYWVPVNDPDTRLQIDPTPAIDIFLQPYGLAILQPWPMLEFGLVDCFEIRFIDVYIEVDLIRNDGKVEVLLHTTRVQQFLGDADAGIGEFYDPTDVVIRVECFDDIPR
jgi:hypothetical protein